MAFPVSPRLARSSRRVIAVALGLAFGPCASASETATSDGPIAVADFFRSPLLIAPQLNHSGTHLVGLVDSNQDRYVAVLYDLQQGGQHVLAGVRDRDVYDAVWLDDDHVLLSQGRYKLYADAMFVVNTARPDRPYPVEEASVVRLVGIPRAAPLHPIVWLKHNAFAGGRDGGAVMIDASTSLVLERDRRLVQTNVPGQPNAHREASAKILERHPAPPGGWETALDYIADQEGDLAFAIFAVEGQPRLHVLQKQTWTRSPLAADDEFTILGPGAESHELWIATAREDDGDGAKPGAVLRVNALSGETLEVVYRDQEFDCIDARLIRNPETRRILGFTFIRHAPTTIWLDPAHGELQRRIEALLPNLAVAVLDLSADEQRLIVEAFSDRSPSAYHLVDLAKPSISRFASSAPWIDPERMRPKQVMQYKTRDGVRVTGYLTLPEGAAKENPAPLVVLPHGGPWARDAWGWDGEVQFLASRGYAVFQPNYRGSTDAQWKFAAEDRWEFRKMHEDVSDGVRGLFKTGLIDPQRVAIMGHSFGGYLAMCGATFDPDLYRCAVTVAGVFDWALLLKSPREDFHGSAWHGILKHELGDPRRQEEKFAAMSPLQHVENVKIPIFVAHGKSDSRVDSLQSQRLVDELKKRRIPHEKFFRSGEGHGMARLEDRVELYTAIEKFLAENLASTSRP